MKYQMPQLPYAPSALAPKMSEETISYHYGKHLQTYVDNLNKLIDGTVYQEMPIEQIIREASGPVFNNAAQVWNHTFFFETLTPKSLPMSAHLTSLIQKYFGSVEAFQKQLFDAATRLFGSGWVWLCLTDRCELTLRSESNAGNPLRDGFTPLLTIDVWEHAYYIDYRNRRAEYIQAVWDLIDWKKVEDRMERSSCNIYI